MNGITEQLILAARNDDVDSWMNILIVVIVAVFWALGGVLKAKKKQQDKELLSAKGPDSRSGYGRKPHRQATGQDRQVPARQLRPVRQYLPRSEQAVSKVRQLSPLPENVSVKEKQQVVMPQPQLSKASVPLAENSQLERTSDELSHFVDEYYSLNIPEIEPASARRQSSVNNLSLDPSFDYEDSDTLRKAILHFEILGKPVALRDQIDRFPGL
jgi:hypothetical protein